MKRRMRNIATIAICAAGLFAAPIGFAADHVVDACLEANIDRFLWVKNVSPDERQGSGSVLLEKTEQVYSNTKKPFSSTIGAWDRGLVPTWSSQSEALDEAVLNLNMPGLKSLGDVRDYLAANRPTTVSGYLNAVRIQFLESKKSTDRQRANMLRYRPIDGITRDVRDPKIASGFEQMVEEGFKRTQLFYACSRLSWWYGGACVEGIAKLVDELRLSGANVLFPGIWAEAFQNPVFSEGLRYLALAILGRVQAPAGVGDFFEDAVLGFKTAGANSKEATELAWKTMALYGNGGQNTGLRALTYDLTERQTITAVSLTMIGSAVTLVDFKQRSQGDRHYALPRGVGGTCLSPKPYHFWMAAYQSHRLLEQGETRRASAYASMTLAKLYQLKRSMNGASGGGIERIFIKPGPHPTLRVVRMDVLLNAAGALYGAGILNPSIDLSQLLRAYDRQAISIPAVDLPQAQELSRDDKAAFDHWESVVRPNFVFERLLVR